MRMIPVMSFVHEIACFYLINRANSALTAPDVNHYYAMTGFNALVSGGNMKIAEGRKERDRRQKRRDQEEEEYQRQQRDGKRGDDEEELVDAAYDEYDEYY